MMISEHRSFGLLLEMERNSGIYQFTRLLILLGQKKQEVFFSSMLSQAVIRSLVSEGMERKWHGKFGMHFLQLQRLSCAWEEILAKSQRINCRNWNGALFLCMIAQITWTRYENCVKPDEIFTYII